MGRSFALSHVHRVREQMSGIGAKGLLKVLVKIPSLEKLDINTLNQLIKQDDETLRAKPSTTNAVSSSSSPTNSSGPSSTTHTPLSTRALRLLNSSIFLHEKDFLRLLPSLYPPLNTQSRSGEIFSQSLRFEVVAFAAGLKSAVLIGWGDGSNPMHSKAAARWTDMVWKEGVMGDFGGEVGERVAQRDGAVRELKAFLEGCKFMIVGNAVTDRSFVLTGHTLLFHQPASAHIRKLLSNPASTSSLLITTSPSPIVEESLIASILDYPVAFPSDSPPPSHPNRPIIVTLGEQFRFSTLHGTQYTALQSLHSQLIQTHFERYKERLRDVLFGVVEICLDGVWGGDAKNEGKRKMYRTDQQAVKESIEEWAAVMNPEEGLRKLELIRRVGRGDAGGLVLRDVMRKGSKDVIRASTPATGTTANNGRPPRTNAPQLSTRALKLLSISLYLHESIFLTHLPDFYDLPPSNEHLKTQSHRFEILQFACGLKPAVFVAHTSRAGGPADPEYSTHVKDKWVGDRWMEQVWRDGLEADLRAWGAASGAGGEEDADVKELDEWVSGCRITVVGDVTTDAGFVLAGYRILYHSLATSQPLIKLLSNSSRPVPFTTTSHVERKQILPEAVFARILDYPVPFPTVPHAQPWEARATVSLGEGFYQTSSTAGGATRRTFFGTAGTTYTALEKDKLTPAIRNHLLKYQKKLDGALFGPVSMRWKDDWEEPKKDEARRMDIVEGPLAVQQGWRLWSEALDVERGFERLIEMLKEASGQQVDPKVIRERLMWKDQVNASSSVPQLTANNPFAILDFEEISSENESEDEEESSLNNITRWADLLHPTSTSSPPTAHDIAQALGTAVELRNSGDAKFRARKLAEAIVEYREAIDWPGEPLEDEEFADLLTRRAITNLRLWNYREAQDDCDEALEYDENSTRAYACYCLASMHLEEYEHIQDLSSKALCIPPADISTKDPRLLDLVRRCQTASRHMIEAKRAAVEAEKRAVVAAAEAEKRAVEEKKAKEEEEKKRATLEEKRKREEAERKASEAKREAAEEEKMRRVAEENKRKLVAEQQRLAAEEKKAAAAALAAKSKPPPPPAPTPPTAAQTKKAKKKKVKKAKKDAESSDDSDMPPLVSSAKTKTNANGASAKPPASSSSSTKKKPAAAADDSSNSDSGPPPLVPISKKPQPSSAASKSTSKPAASSTAAPPPSDSDSDEGMPPLVAPSSKKTKTTPPVASKSKKASKKAGSDSDSGMPPLVPVTAASSKKDQASSKGSAAKPSAKEENEDGDSGSDNSMPELIPVNSNKANGSANKNKPAAPTPSPQPKPTPASQPAAAKKPAAPAPPPSKGPLWSGTDSSDSMPELKKAQLPKPPKRKKKVKTKVVVDLSDSDWGVLVPIPPPPPPQPPKPQTKAAPPAPKPTPTPPAPKPTPASAPKAKAAPPKPPPADDSDADLPDLIEVASIPGNISAKKPAATPPPPAPKVAPAPKPTPAAAKKATPAAKPAAKKMEPKYVPPSDSEESDSMPALLPIGSGTSTIKPTAPTPPPASSSSANKKPAPSSKARPAPKKVVEDDSDEMPDLVAIEPPQTTKKPATPPQPKKEVPKSKPAPKAAPPPKKAAAYQFDSDSDGPPPLISVGPSGTTVPPPPKANNDNDTDSDSSLPDLVSVNEGGAAKAAVDPVTGQNIRKTTPNDPKAKNFKDQGNVQFKAGQYAEARRLYSEGIKLNPSDDLTHDLFNNRAATSTKMNLWTEAIEDCEKALRIKPTSVKALFRKAQDHFNLNQFRISLELCNSALGAGGGMESEIRALRKKAAEALKK